MFDEFIKKKTRKLVIKMQKQFYRLLYKTKFYSNYINKILFSRIKTTRSKKFQIVIAIYNNIFFFINKSTKVNYEHSTFNTFRYINNIKYFIDILLANFDDLIKFY